MSWLQSIDAAAFRFINDTLQNAFFDAVMPVFAGPVWFFPVLIILGLAAIWKGGTRGRLCMAMLVVMLPIGDAWITNTLKRAIDRPRPCLALENVNLPMRREAARPEDEWYRRGCSSSGSMPSGHTTNWFAATLVAAMFYRRTLGFMLPLACLVGFSRIYNGFHYPGDVLAGAILGAGYGAAIVLALDFAWQFAGKRWFPIWWNALPSLLLARIALPESHSPFRASHSALESHWLRLGYVLIGGMFVWRLTYIAGGTIELSEDEAYQWLWSKHLALSYFSKPPLIAYAQWLSTSGFGDHAFSVRFFSPVAAAIGSAVVLRFFAKNVNARAGFWLIAIANVTPLLCVGSTLFTVDSLLVLFWTLAMVAAWCALQPDGTTRHWLITGLWLGLAFLSKYTALLQWLCLATFFALWKPARVHLRKPGPYAALAVNAVLALPVFIWNAQHDWILVQHVARDAKLAKPWQFDPMNSVEFLGGTAGVLHPIFFLAAIWAAIAMWRRNARDPLPRFLFAMGAPVLVVYLLYTIHSSVQANWIAASVIPLLCLMVVFWEQRAREGVRLVRPALIIALLIGGGAFVLLHNTDFVKKVAGVYLPAQSDPLRRVRGWKQMAKIVERERAKLEAESKPVFIIGHHYGTTSLLTFYIKEARTNVSSAPIVYYRKTLRPNSQFYFWPGYSESRRGQNALYVQEKEERTPPPPEIVQQFESVTDLGQFLVLHRDRVMHRVQIFACRNLR